MKQYLKQDPWCIIEEGFIPAYNEISESVFSIANGKFGQRANFEEQYAGKTLQGNYVAGVYYPDKTRVGWWKNGYPEYFAKVLNAPNWLGIEVTIDGAPLDLSKCAVTEFRRTLNMKEGWLQRTAVVEMPNGHSVKIDAKRFISVADTETAAIRYAITPLETSAEMAFNLFVDGDIKNKDANYDEKFWNPVATQVSADSALITMETKKTGFHVCTGMTYRVWLDGKDHPVQSTAVEKEKYVAHSFAVRCNPGQEVVVYKYVSVVSSENHTKDSLLTQAASVLASALDKGYHALLKDHTDTWANKWEQIDIQIKGDVAAQQGIRFSIFQMHQTYSGEDARLNIGPKGFTGEKYGGSTYWDTEAYCLPFYLSTASEQVARNLLIYRHNHLEKAIENAEKLGFTNGAALYPMVTMNGEECHNEWEITFEEIHRNGAIAYAIYNYINYTGDKSYLISHGLEVLLGIARFWSQRINWSAGRQQYVMLGVTGPNEYENNVNNNWYTNTIATWCIQYTMEAVDYVKSHDPKKYVEIKALTGFDEEVEPIRWRDILDKMYYPEERNLGIFLQQDGFMDKDLTPVNKLDPKDLPLCQKWSWDRILRSCYIKQADVLQGLFFFEDQYDIDTIKRNFDFYEPLTVHESSLSSCVYSILAAKIGYKQKAYDLYLRAARLDLDDYNNDSEDGLHITSMAGSWMNVVMGFGGMRVKNGQLHFTPFIPDQWDAYSFKVNFRGSTLKVTVTHQGVEITNLSNDELTVIIFSKEHRVSAIQKAEAIY